MAAVYPSSLSAIPDLSTSAPTKLTPEYLNSVAEEVNAIEAELGINPSDTYSTVKARLDDIASKVYTNVLVASNYKILEFTEDRSGWIGINVVNENASSGVAFMSIKATGSGYSKLNLIDDTKWIEIGQDGADNTLKITLDGTFPSSPVLTLDRAGKLDITDLVLEGLKNKSALATDTDGKIIEGSGSSSWSPKAATVWAGLVGAVQNISCPSNAWTKIMVMNPISSFTEYMIANIFLCYQIGQGYIPKMKFVNHNDPAPSAADLTGVPLDYQGDTQYIKSVNRQVRLTTAYAAGGYDLYIRGVDDGSATGKAMTVYSGGQQADSSMETYYF